jgi:predicted dithiol-disulfide oxidoreductase (DUF899 family)
MIGTREEWLSARRELPWCSSWQLLDGAPTGRGSSEDLGDWPRRHDEYKEALHAG